MAEAIEGTDNPLNEEVMRARKAAEEAMDELREKLGPPVHFQLTTKGLFFILGRMAKLKVKNARYALGCSIYRLSHRVAGVPIDYLDV